jgi:hypothetical protein
MVAENLNKRAPILSFWAKNLNNGDIIERFLVLLQRTTDTLYLSDFFE